MKVRIIFFLTSSPMPIIVAFAKYKDKPFVVKANIINIGMMIIKV